MGDKFTIKERVAFTIFLLLVLTFGPIVFICHPDWVKENKTFIDIVLMFTYVFATIIIVWMMQKTLEVTVKLEKERIHPRIIFDFDFGPQYVHAEVRNDGLSPARDVKMKFSPEISKVGVQREVDFAFNYTIPYLAPNSKKRSLLMESEKFLQKYRDVTFDVKISYKKSADTEKNNHTAEENFSYNIPIDLNYARNTLFLNRPDIGTQLEKVGSNLRLLQYTISKIERVLEISSNSPPPLRVGISNEPYSQKALAVARAFVELFDKEKTYNLRLTNEKIIQKTELTENDAKSGINELIKHGFVTEDSVASIITAEELLFVEFDRFWTDWDAEEDAKKIAKGMLDKAFKYEYQYWNIKEPSKLMKQIADFYGWTPRQLNPALCWLEKRKLVTLYRAWWSNPFVCYAIATNRAFLEHFVKKYSIEPQLDDNRNTKDDD